MIKYFRCLNLFVAIVMVIALFGIQQPAKAQTGSGHRDKSGNAAADFVPGQIVVGFENGKSQTVYTSQATALAVSLGGSVSKVNGSGLALLNVAQDADVQALAAGLQGSSGVLFAEPNYIFSLPPLVAADKNINQNVVIRQAAKGNEQHLDGKSLVAVPVDALKAMQTKVGSKVQATYPNDPYLWWGGWSFMGADIVSPNKTASANICEIDTGVDYTHPDLAGQIIKGYDFVNDDADPMDDYGHGTHVAGIMVAKSNNSAGISGVSTGKVVAVKALNAQGSGTNYDVASAIGYCALRSDVKVISMSLGGPQDSDSVYWAIDHAVLDHNKLIVAAAGNTGDNSTKMYPGAYSDTTNFPEFTDMVLSVGASGQYWTSLDGYQYVDYSCSSDYTSYGSWVSVVAPGTDIYSTTPWDKPFYLNYYDGVATRYDYMSGTSMATPYVAATAARRWGYKPLETNAQIGLDVIYNNSGHSVNADGTCWPSSMPGVYFANVAAVLERFGMSLGAYDATSGIPLNGASLMAYQYDRNLLGTGVIVPSTSKSMPWELDPSRIYTWYTAFTDIINLPGGWYTEKVSKSGYTSGAQNAFQHSQWAASFGYWGYPGRTGVPPTSSNFEEVMGFLNWYRSDYPTHYLQPLILNDVLDLDLNIWLPDTPNPLDPGQPAHFIVGASGKDYAYFEGDSTGETIAFPFAQLQRDSLLDGLWLETIRINSRAVHGLLPTNKTVPYYPGLYAGVVTDYGQTVDQDGDGCGNNYGLTYDPAYDNTCGGSGTPGIPILGVYLTPYVYVWKDGVIKYFVNMTAGNNGYPYDVGDACNSHEWGAVGIYTGALSGPVEYSAPNFCGDSAGPYVNLPGVDDRANMKAWLTK